MPFDADSFLTEFGYLDPAAAGDEDARESAVAVAQGAYGIPVTGDLDPMTERVFDRTPRCGVSDAEGLADGAAYWGLKEISWQAASVPVGVGLTRAQVEGAIEEAFAHWSFVCPLKFRKVSVAPNIIFRSGRGRRSNFDGPGGTLAWMHLPNRPNFTGTLEGAFDADEPWVVDISASGIRMVNVACHEIGHALGFMHSRKAGQLMSPTYHRDLTKPQSEDVQRVQKVYGKPTVAPPPPPGSSAPVKAQILLSDNSVFEFANPKKLR